MIKAPHKSRGIFIMSSFRWKLAYLMHIPLETSRDALVARHWLRMCVKSQSKVETFFLTFYGRKKWNTITNMNIITNTITNIRAESKDAHIATMKKMKSL
ncbi:MAG: hypothetical protein K2J68_04045 [Treponemataceae bacterium]|nr:hypothetical protein [Treponemataceae bacterium]